MDHQQPLRKISEVGEFSLIEELTRPFQSKHSELVVGIGDDAAGICLDDELVQVISTDFLVEGVHFDPMYMPLKHLGYKAVSVNVSDICAMNATANFITVSIAVSSKYSVEALEELYAGIHAACEKFSISLVGGDTTAAPFGLTISITILGKVEKTKITKRSGAKNFDLLVVSGDLGGAYMGLQVLEREKEVFKANPKIQPELEGFDYIIQRQLKPEARKDIITILNQLGVVPTSMIDVSDGLASEILHLCKASQVGCHLYGEKIPMDTQTIQTALDFDLDPATVSLNGGEDYELLFTIDQKDVGNIQSNPHFAIIGHITDANDGIYHIDKQGTAVALKAQGWKHFN
ncbi:MAG: thiamine-phosphate kinase [Bacteroidetes bacterium]|nr:thiamine-phosphate kinase [Bacteroidota bacterium]